METIKFDGSPVEPAHPMVIKLHDDLVAIYTHLREKYQVEVDQAFDRVSQQIGFVVTTTVPVVLEVGKGGGVKRVSMGAEHLQDTLFDRELSTALKAFTGDSIPIVSAGTYNLYLFWFEALKLKLRTDWMEPAHFVLPADLREKIREIEEILAGRREMQMKKDVIKPKPWPGDPPHWFDPGTLIAAEEKVLISAIDEVYSELRLVDRIASYREALRRQVRPEVMEPAHFRRIERGMRPENPEELLRLIRIMLDRV